MSPHKSSKLVAQKSGMELRGSIPPRPAKRKLNMLDFKKDTTLGYMYAYEPSHPLANKAGKVYEHIYVMCNHIGRKLNPDECVHHIDRIRENNSLSNLRLMTFAEHARLHAIEDRGIQFKEIECLNCKSKIHITSTSTQQYCSIECFHKQRLKFEISKEDLEILVWSLPTTQVAELLGVSDVAISKRCKSLGITKPPRGFWAKVNAGLLIANGLPQ